MKYTIPGLSVLLSVIGWSGEQWLSQAFNQAFASAPWGWMLLSALALLIGVLYADLWNEDSPLRAAVRRSRKIVEVENFVLAHRVEGGKSWYEAVIHSKFLRPSKNVHCSIQVTQYAGLKHAEQFLVSQEHVSNAERNLRKAFVVAKFPQRTSREPQDTPYWGSEPKHTWAGDGKHVVALKLSAGLFRRQTEQFLVSAIRDVGEGPEPVILFGGPSDASFIQIGRQA